MKTSALRMKTFKIGGIHPPDYKLTAQHPIHTTRLPETAVVLLNQHLGALAQPLVGKGDQVKVGQLIAKANGFISANIHAPVSGKVVKVEPVADVTGYAQPAIHIAVEGDEWLESIDRSDDLITTCDLEPKAIVDRIFEAGIVGLGGACFPTHVKLSPPPGKQASCIIVNAVECEPYLTTDHRLLLEKGEEIVVGLCLAMKATNAPTGYIGIEANKKDAILYLQSISKKYPGIQVVPLQMKYPQGGEKQLIDAITGCRVPSGKLPIDVGAIVLNASTTFAIYEAVQKKKPLIERVLTVTGEALTQPGNYRVRIGSPMSLLAEEAGGVPENTAKLVTGGPMMGKALSSLNCPVTKGSGGLLMLASENAVRKPSRQCIRCGKCITACPMGLEPHLFMTLAEFEAWDQLEKAHIMDCIECGCCTFSCPSNRPLLDYLRIGKTTVGRLRKTRQQA